MKIESHEIEISNREKIFFPDNEITKGDLIDYYNKIADRMLPYLEDRPLTMRRFPDGIETEGFYQKKASDYFPDWIKTVNVKKKEGGSVQQVICNNKSTLIYLVNQGTVSFHPWLSTTEDINKPDKLVFDLDPPEGNFDLVIKGAKAMRKLLEEEVDLNAFLMTTGSEGMHVVSPIRADYDFEKVHSFTEKIAQYLARENPDDFTTKVRKNKRGDRLFLDHMRNSYAQTSIAPYSVRALEGAPIAVPLSWDELGKKDLRANTYNINNIFKRLSQKEKVWSQFRNKAKKVDHPMEKLEALSNEA